MVKNTESQHKIVLIGPQCGESLLDRRYAKRNAMCGVLFGKQSADGNVFFDEVDAVHYGTPCRKMMAEETLRASKIQHSQVAAQ
jgi:hypothetical protein